MGIDLIVSRGDPLSQIVYKILLKQKDFLGFSDKTIGLFTKGVRDLLRVICPSHSLIQRDYFSWHSITTVTIC